MLQNEYKTVCDPFKIGDLIKPNEPYDAEYMIIAEDIKVGRFVKKFTPANECEQVYNLAVSDTLDSIWGISLNAVPRSDSDAEYYEYNKNDDPIAFVGRVTSKLSVLPVVLIQTGVTPEELLSAKRYAIAGGPDTGAMFLATTTPTDSSTTKYIELPSNTYRLRVSGTQQIYLEITP
jgi:hypothetical protein